jgi:hypothetical protein
MNASSDDGAAAQDITHVARVEPRVLLSEQYADQLTEDLACGPSE